jgi:hypothetical protein
MTLEELTDLLDSLAPVVREEIDHELQRRDERIAALEQRLGGLESLVNEFRAQLETASVLEDIV